MSGSSGAQRTINFSRYLPEFGWKPIILTVHPRAHPRINTENFNNKMSDIEIFRTFALDTARHLSVMGRYPSFLAWPDRWVSWWFSAVPRGLSIINKYKPEVIWSTYPIATAHLIGLTLSRLSGLPWVADFRDPMTEDNYPDKFGKKIIKKLEDRIINSADSLVLTTPGAIRAYQKLYPGIEEKKWSKIENGFDEESFQKITKDLTKDRNVKERKPFRIVHSGLLYPVERDPKPFLDAIAELKKSGQISAQVLNIILRASGHDELYRKIINELDIKDIVSLEKPKSYLDALSEMMQCDGLLIFQSGICNNQIPAKIYEYLRAGKPILALADPEGDTANLLFNLGIKTIVPIDEKDKIKKMLINFIQLLESGDFARLSDDIVNKFSRRMQTKEFSDLLNNIVLSKK